MLGLGLLQLVLPRRYAYVPVAAAGCYMTLGQTILIAGGNFNPMRILILFGIARILVRREFIDIRFNAIDGVLVTWLAVSSFLFMLLDGTNGSWVGRFGYAYNAAGSYLLVRASVRSLDDIVAVTRWCAIIIVPLGALFVIEGVTGRNPFAVLGGVPIFSEIRDGRVRAQGPFMHSILAGTFAATAWPMLVGLWVYGKGNRLVATLAMVSTITIVVASSSSGPISTFVIGSLALACWACRRQMRAIRWGMILGILALAVGMKAPVWFLIDRLSSVIGGSGWYRSALIDAAIHHFDEWWLAGSGYTAHWMPTTQVADTNHTDFVNEFVFQGVHGGILALLLFLWLIVKCFKTLGRSVHRSEYSPRTRFLVWSMGCGFVGHVASFFSVSYWDQIIIFWYLLLGMIAVLAHRAPAQDLVADLNSTATTTPIARRFVWHGRMTQQHVLPVQVRNSGAARSNPAEMARRISLEQTRPQGFTPPPNSRVRTKQNWR